MCTFADSCANCSDENVVPHLSLVISWSYQQEMPFVNSPPVLQKNHSLDEKAPETSEVNCDTEGIKGENYYSFPSLLFLYCLLMLLVYSYTIKWVCSQNNLNMLS